MNPTPSTRKSLDLLVIDDHRIVLFGISTLLASCASVGSITKASTPEEALEIASARRFDVVIVDVELEGTSGLDLLPELRRLNPGISVIFHSMHEEIWIIRQMMEAAPDAIVLKGDTLEELKVAVETVAGGGKYFSTRYEKYCRKATEEPVLSPREMEVLRAMGEGLTSAEIGEHLFVSTNTIEFHRKNILRKLGASNVADLIRKAVALGYLPL